MSKYSLRSQYRNILKERYIENEEDFRPELQKAGVFMGTQEPLVELEKGVFVGRFDEKSLSLWNEKDGSGGRGEYTVASHFLESNLESAFKRQSADDFFRNLSTDYSFVDEVGFDSSDEAEAIFDKFKRYLTTLGLELMQPNFDSTTVKNHFVILKTNPEDLAPGIKSFVLDNKRGSTWNTVRREINKERFLKSLETNMGDFVKDDKALYDLLTSVTTSGEASKSTDIMIPINRVRKDFISTLNTNEEHVTIEVKEISDITATVDGGSGIRLASGSRLEAMKNDIIFCLTILCIITDLSESDTFFESENKFDSNAKQILISFKNNQVAASKVKSLISYLSHPSAFRRMISGFVNLINSSSFSETKRQLGFSTIKHLENLFGKEMSSSDRRDIIEKGLSTSIANSVKASYFCVIHGHDSAKYKKAAKSGAELLGNDQFILIHKSRYSDILGFGSYQNGGTAYATIKDKNVSEYFRRLFSSKTLKNESFAFNSINILSLTAKREKFIKSLKEEFSFKKKLISEGGLGGHMMHPYEALDMTPRQIIDRVKEYSTSQSIIEKVDGQNLFFTVEQDGTLMFARNKEDMTHDDLVTKFTGHPAELPFVEGGNAIKRGVDQWLSSAGSASEMEIREIFQPSGETKSFINFEIMHPDKPNQIIYDEKYIVFHSIVDFVNGRESAYSSNKSQRLQDLIKRMQSGVSSAGFTLASNRTVDLNQLSNVQIEDYVSRIKEVTQLLQITEDEFLGDGIEKLIEKEIDELGVSISEKDLRILYDFVIYGETKAGVKIKSKDFMSSVAKYDLPKLRSINVTSSAKALKKVQRIISPFKEIFVDLGIDLLKGVKSAYMSDATNQMNIDLLKDKLQTAVDDLSMYTSEVPESEWPAEVHRLKPHLDKVIVKDIENIVSTAVEGGVYDHQGDLLKVTGGFAPMNQILGAAYRDKKGIFPTFKEKFMQQESNRRSLRSVFNLIY